MLDDLAVWTQQIDILVLIYDRRAAATPFHHSASDVVDDMSSRAVTAAELHLHCFRAGAVVHGDVYRWVDPELAVLRHTLQAARVLGVLELMGILSQMK